MTMDLLERNLAELKAHQKAAYFCIVPHLKNWHRTAAEGNRVKNEQVWEARGTTLVSLGIDEFLSDTIEALLGENNLLVVEDDMERLLAVLSRLEQTSAFLPERVRWLLSEEMIAALNPEEALLGRVKILNPNSARRSSLVLSALKFLKQSLIKQAKAREHCEATYLVMVTYNRLRLTELTVDRLNSSATSPFKLVILDNGSEDGTRDWLKGAWQKYKFIDRVIFLDKNLGIGRALNSGMIYALSRTAKIGRIDNDVLVPPHWLENLSAVLHSPLRPAVVSGFVTGDPNAHEQLNKARQEIIGDLKIYDVEYAGGCLNLYDPRIFDEFGFFPEYPLFGVEDGGLCRAVRAAQRHVVVVENVRVDHLPSLSLQEQDYMNFKNDELKKRY